MSRETLRARLEAATPGPWRLHPDEGGMVVQDTDDESGLLVSDYSDRTDARFIAHARQDVPALLKALEMAELSLAHAEHFECDFAWCEALRDAIEELDALP